MNNVLNKDKNLLVIGSISARYRKYILDSAVDLGIGIILITDKDVSWETQITKQIIFANTLDSNEMYDRITACVDISKIDGIFTYDENAIVATAQLAKRFNLKYLSVEVAEKCRDKYLMRSELQKAYLHVPNFKKISSEKEIYKFIEKYGLPVIIKPIDGWGSIGVIKIENINEVGDVYRSVRNIRIKNKAITTFIIEEFIVGSEFSVESIVVGDVVHHFGITKKFKCNEPYFEEIGHEFPANLKKDIENEIYKVCTQGIKALGINIGATHTEVILSKNGPVIVEIAARLGGDKIPMLVQLATGNNIAKNAIRVSLGLEMEKIKNINKGAAIRFIIPKKEGKLIQYPNLEYLNSIDNIYEISFKGKVDKLELPPNKFYTRLGFIIATGDTSEKAYETVSNAEQLLQLNIK